MWPFGVEEFFFFFFFFLLNIYLYWKTFSYNAGFRYPPVDFLIEIRR